MFVCGTTEARRLWILLLLVFEKKLAAQLHS